MKKRLLIAGAVLAVVAAGLCYAEPVYYQWLIPNGSSVRMWAPDPSQVLIDPSGLPGTYDNKTFFFTNYSTGQCWAGMASDNPSVPRAEIYIQRENSAVNDNASAWMYSSGGAKFKAWSAGNATMAGSSGAKVEAATNGDVIITLGQ